MKSDKMTLIAGGLLVGALVYKFAPKLKMMAEEVKSKTYFLNLFLCSLRRKKKLL